MNNTLVALYQQFHTYKQRSLKPDLVAALVVFFVAIPLCLGIALASGAPLFSGILSGIIGGIIVGSLSGSHVSVSGPAAGLAAVVITAIAQLGDFNTFLLALCLAGVFQLITGTLRAGFFAEYVPSNIIQGLLSAVGVLLIFKQLPLAFTLTSSLSELKMHLLDATEGFSLKPLRDVSYHINSGAMIISVISLLILIYFEKTSIKWLKAIPGTIVVVLFGIALNEVFVLTHSYLAQNSLQLVNIPQHSGLNDWLEQLHFPKWSAWSNPDVYIYAGILAIVASLESLLNIKASEKLDTRHTRISKNRELVAQGIGNIAAGLIGGIPVTSVIVRTSVNLQAGAKTKASAIFHGFYLLFAILLIPAFLNRIPICSLAAVLIFTGYKLSSPKLFKTIYRQGPDRFIPFLVTLIGIVTLNILTGIIIGLLTSLFFILKSNSQARLDIIKEFYPNGVTQRLILPQQTTFLNKASLIEELDDIPAKSQLIIDARYSKYIDKEIIELISEFQEEQAPRKNISLNLIGFKKQYTIQDHINFINVTTYDVQAALSPQQVLNILHEGNQRFLDDTRIHRSLTIDIKHTAVTQHPIAVILGCIDSRVPVETVFDMSFGDLFCVRVAGNVVNDDVLASIEYACHVVGAKLIVVLGHTRCGAVEAACTAPEQTGHVPQLLEKLKPAIDAENRTHSKKTTCDETYLGHVTELNVANTLYQVYQQSDVLREQLDAENIAMVGAVYDVNTGKVSFKDFAERAAQLPHKPSEGLTKHLNSLVSPKA
ncbi:MAG: SulP family inorganic anion transporter [Legionellaceae bacterium]|nr:SulP family inorganic anion transporter [Legionellaceae bacterium]